MIKNFNKNTNWEIAYNGLNESQRKAADAIEGPLMVLAGPGTGKTQLLAVRVGNILRLTDVYPQNILCITYTDAGAVAMRRRLEKFIGPDAHKVVINTYHSFCNTILQENISKFGDYRELSVVDDLEVLNFMQELIDGFPYDHPLKRTKARSEYYDVDRFKDLFSVMKKEGWTKEDIIQKLTKYKEFISSEATSPYVYQKKVKHYEKGQLKDNLVKEITEKLNATIAAANSFDDYNKILRKHNRIDFSDMILWVIKKLKEDDIMLSKYQERFQYILVDEYQDTNGSQNAILHLLSDFWDSPNLFVVGDDDQSIYKFQGADSSNIYNFVQKYNPEIIVLDNNYRSHQIILDTATQLISNNTSRIVNKVAGITKNLIAKNYTDSNNPLPQILTFENEKAEEWGIIQKISELHENGVEYKDIAVLYTKHEYSENIVKYLSLAQIPFSLQKNINALYEIDTIRLINLLKYINEESKRPYIEEVLLFEIMHYEYFDILTTDIGLVFYHVHKENAVLREENKKVLIRQRLQDRDWLELIKVKNVEKICAFATMLESWIAALHNHTVQILIEKIMTESSMLEKILISKDRVWRLQVVSAFFDFIKNMAAKKVGLTLSNLMEALINMQEEKVELPIVKNIVDKNGVNFMTAYASKGLEFKHVFIIKCNKKFWESKQKSNNKFYYKEAIVYQSENEESDIEEMRRLFYVAMTRAEIGLYMTKSLSDAAGKGIDSSQFLSELPQDQVEKISIPLDTEGLVDYNYKLMKDAKGQVSLIEKEYIAQKVANIRINTTGLNKYLKCPLSFYYENILSIPMARNPYTGFGNAVHFALEKLFYNIESSVPRSVPSMTFLLENFHIGMTRYVSHFTPKQYENYLNAGKTILEKYYQNYSSSWFEAKKYVLEYPIQNVVYHGVPLSGKIDRINIYDDQITVFDFKTGAYKRDKVLGPNPEKNTLGGDYWRQIVFYKILIDNDTRQNWKMDTGFMDFVEQVDNKFYLHEIHVTPEDIALVTEQITTTYKKIQNHEFDKGCGKDDCQWCNFTKKHTYQMKLPEEELSDTSI